MGKSINTMLNISGSVSALGWDGYILKSCLITYYLCAQGFNIFIPQFPFLLNQCLCRLSCFSHIQLCDAMGYLPPGSSVHGVLQAKILEWVSMPRQPHPRGSVRSRVRHYWQNGGTAPNLLSSSCRHGPGMKELALVILTCSFLSLVEWLERMLRCLREAWESTKPSTVVSRK